MINNKFKFWPLLFIAIPLFFTLSLYIYPMFRGIYYSFTDWNGLSLSHNFIALENYVNLFKDHRFLSSIKFTFSYTLLLVIGEVTLGILLAYIVNKKAKFNKFLKVNFFLPSVISTIVISMVFKQFFNYGLTSLYQFMPLKIFEKTLLAEPSFAFWAVLFVGLWQGIAIPFLLFLSAMQSIPKQIIEAARIDGAGKISIFKNITLPYLFPSILMVIILGLKSGLTSFDLIVALTGGGPQDSTISIGLLIYNYAFKTNKFSQASAMSVLIFLLILLGSFLNVYIQKRRLSNETKI